jgi:hypothetical protein
MAELPLPATETRRLLRKIRIDYPTSLRKEFQDKANWYDQYGCVQQVEVTQGSYRVVVVEFSGVQCPASAAQLADAGNVSQRLLVVDNGEEDDDANPILDLVYQDKVVGRLVDYLSLSTNLLSIESLCQVGTPKKSCTATATTDLSGRKSALRVNL